MHETSARPTKKKSAFARAKLWLACWLGFLIYRLLTATYRYRFHEAAFVKEAQDAHPHKSFIFAIWHEHFFCGIPAHKRYHVVPMISRSNDGEIISFIASRLGYDPVRGSTSRGGEEARQELYERLNAGLVAAFTVDGPKGPRHKVKSGVIDLARSGQLMIVPIGFACRRSWILSRAWDQTLIPKPFALIDVCYGKPLAVSADTHGRAFAAAKQELGTRLNYAGAYAKRESGVL